MNLFRSNKSAALLAIILALAVIVSIFAGSTLATEEPERIKRLWGQDRYETSAAIVLDYLGLDPITTTETHVENSTTTIIIARGDDKGDWADGLAGGYLAGVKEAPILLTKTNELPDVIVKAIEKIDPVKAYILGGPEAVSEDVETALEALGLETERIQGDNREETAAKIAGEGAINNNTAFITQGRAPADSMIAGAAAFMKGYPILLVKKDSVPDVTATAITDLGIEHLIIVGGTAVVSANVETELGGIEGVLSVTRLSGDDREKTSVEFAKGQFPGSEDFSIVNGRRGLADAVGASVFGDPILYVNSFPEAVKEYLDNKVTASSILRIAGGTAVVSASSGDLLIDILDKAPPGPNLVVLLPQTGLLELAETSAEAALLAAEDVNTWLESEGKEWRLHLTIQDTHLNHKYGRRLVEKWNEKGVKFFAGPMVSGVAAGILDYINTNELLVISPSSTDPGLAFDDWLFRFCYIYEVDPPAPQLGTDSYRDHVKDHILTTLDREPDEYAYNTYDAIWVLARSIVEKGYDSSAVRPHLPQIAEDWSRDYAASGLIVLDDNGDRIAPPE